MNKSHNQIFFTASNEIIWLKKIQLSCMGKKADMALFNLCMEIKKCLGQMYSFEVVNNSQLFIHKVLLAPSKCLFKWIKVDK